MKKIDKIPEILLVTRPLNSPWDEASKNFAFSLASSLEQFKFHILVGEYHKNLPSNIIQHKIYKGASWDSIRQKSRLVLKLFLILKRNPSINIVHLLFAPTPLNAQVLKSILRRFPIKVIQTIACLPEIKKEGINSLLFADKLIVYSKYTKKQLLAADPSYEKRILTIPPFIDFSKFPVVDETQKEHIRKKWRIKKEEKIILYPGEYSRLKAMDNLISGFTEIRHTLPDAKLLIACRIKNNKDKKEERKIKKTISNKGLSGSINFLGKVDDIEELYYLSDIVVFPATSMKGKFDFPFVLLEALSCGTPILTSDVAALAEIWDGKESDQKKYTYSNGNLEQFVKKCILVLAKKTWDGQELAKYIQNKFSKEKTLEDYSDLYYSSLPPKL